MNYRETEEIFISAVRQHPEAVLSFHYDLIKQLKIIMLAHSLAHSLVGSFVLSLLAEIIVYRFNFWLFRFPFRRRHTPLTFPPQVASTA